MRGYVVVVIVLASLEIQPALNYSSMDHIHNVVLVPMWLEKVGVAVLFAEGTCSSYSNWSYHARQ